MDGVERGMCCGMGRMWWRVVGRKGETVNGMNLFVGLMGEGGAGALVFFV